MKNLMAAIRLALNPITAGQINLALHIINATDEAKQAPHPVSTGYMESLERCETRINLD